jgi:hypothetical protein
VLLQVSSRPDARLIAATVRRGLRRPLLLARVAGWLTIVLAVALDGLNPALLLLGVVLAVAVPMVLVNGGTRRLVRDGDLTTYEISDSGVASSSMQSRHAYAWHAFTYVERAPGHLVFGRGPGRFLPVPTTGLSPAQIDQVLGTAAGHGLPVRRP